MRGVHGFLAGCALWLKYTVLGFYIAWVVVLAVVYLWCGRAAQLGKSVAAYLGGMALATLPWVIYFGVNSALEDWFTCYFYETSSFIKERAAGHWLWPSTFGGPCGTPCLRRCC